MDILQFLAPGYNLKSFFKAFGVSEQKVSFLMIISHMQINLTKPHYHLMKLFILPLKAVRPRRRAYRVSKTD